MKITIDIPQELIERIADAVVERLRPITQDSAASGGDLLRALPHAGYLRLKELLGLIPVSRSTWYQGIAAGKYPKPTKKLGPRISAWDVRDIRRLLQLNPGP